MHSGSRPCCFDEELWALAKATPYTVENEPDFSCGPWPRLHLTLWRTSLMKRSCGPCRFTWHGPCLSTNKAKGTRPEPRGDERNRRHHRLHPGSKSGATQQSAHEQSLMPLPGPPVLPPHNSQFQINIGIDSSRDLQCHRACVSK